MAITLWFDTITIDHNGQPDELSYSWDKETGTLTLDGFKRLDGTLTWLKITHSFLTDPTEIFTNYIGISIWNDIHDIRDDILTYLTTLIVGGAFETIVEIPASVTISANLKLSYFDFDQLVPTMVASSVGTGIWTSGGPLVEDKKLAHMQGISAARGRLLAWDRENAVYRSALLDPMDFKPSLETQAAVGKVQAVRGNIIFIANYPEGYTIYSTDNIVIAKYTGDSYVFSYTELADVGVADPRHLSAKEMQHIVYTANGLYRISPREGKYEEIDPVTSNYLASYAWPFEISFIENRYVCIGLSQIPGTEQMLLSHRNLTGRTLPTVLPPGIELEAPSYPYNIGYVKSTARILVYDMHLQRWGSCDTGAMRLFGCTPINASGLRIDKLTKGRDETWRHAGRGLGIISPTGKVAIATSFPQGGADLWLGYPRMHSQGYTTFLEARTECTPGSIADYTFTARTYDELGLAEVSVGAPTEVQDVSIGKFTTFDLDATGAYGIFQVHGVFDLTQLRYAAIKQGRL
jgi:hypothetical protein